MKVILLKDIKGVGKRFEEKNVSDGFAMNQLIPKKLAVPASNAGQVKTLIENKLAEEASTRKHLEENLNKINGTEITLSLKANEKNHLFASLTAQKLSEILKKEKNIEINPDLIKLENSIKETGTFEIPVRVGEKQVKFTLVVLRA
jgi:large subunit ribosomal protein L9